MCLPNPRPKCYFYNREICIWSTFMYIELVEKNDGTFVYAHMCDGNAILKSWKKMAVEVKKMRGRNKKEIRQWIFLTLKQLL
jgi:hypothetical protein